MAKHECPPEGAPEWMATYGDMVTLLLCFFVLLFSMSTIQKVKFEKLSENLKQTLGVLPSQTRIEYSSAQSRPDAKVKKTEDIKTIPGEHPISSASPPQDVIVIGGPVYFEKGSADLNADQYSVLHEISNQLRGTTQVVEVHGYCSPDSDDISPKFVDKLELSFFRAMSVISFLTDKKYGKISRDRIRIYTHGEFDFSQTQLFTENRKQMQRVEVITSPSASGSVKDTKEAQ